MNCEQLRSSMLAWFGSEFECQNTGNDSLTATLPVLKPNGDFIEIGVEQFGDQMWRLSDLGDTYAALYLAGVELNEQYSRAEEFRQIVKAHRIQNAGQELTVDVPSSELAGGVFDLVQAIQSMLALQYTVRPRQSNRDFASVVAKFLAENRMVFEIPTGFIQGRTGRWRFNFLLRKPGQEALLKTLTATSKGDAMKGAKQSVFEFQDVHELHPHYTERLVVLDDEGEREELWKPSVMRVFSGYKIEAVQFHQERDRLLELASRFAA